MKSIRNIALAAVAVILASCMGNYDDEPTMQLPPYGNNNINEENIISIGKLKQIFDKQLSTDQRDGVSYAQVLNDIKIRGWVTANDIEGNIYNEIGLSDDTGAILVCISQGGLFGYLPVGTEIIIDLNELYVGAYGLQPEIGTPYTNKNGLTYVSRMSRTLWASHFKIVGAKPAHEITPMTFDKQKVTDAAYLKENCGKLMTIKDVEFSDAKDGLTFAPEEEKDAANCVARPLKGINASNLVVRTSTYADFAAKQLPKGKVNITGLFTRYGSTWQILLRSSKDVEPAEAQQE